MDGRRWEFWDWGTIAGSAIKEWYDGLSEQAQDKLDNLLKVNSKTDNPRDWLGFKYMLGELRDEKIWQLAFPHNNIQDRILGIFGAKRKQAIILIGYIHKGNVYTPKGALKVAASRAKPFRLGKGEMKLYEHKIRTDL